MKNRPKSDKNKAPRAREEYRIIVCSLHTKSDKAT